MLNTTVQTRNNLTWNDVNYIEMDTKWRLLSISDAGLEVSWILEVRNTHPTRSATPVLKDLPSTIELVSS